MCPGRQCQLLTFKGSLLHSVAVPLPVILTTAPPCTPIGQRVCTGRLRDYLGVGVELRCVWSLLWCGRDEQSERVSRLRSRRGCGSVLPCMQLRLHGTTCKCATRARHWLRCHGLCCCRRLVSRWRIVTVTVDVTWLVEHRHWQGVGPVCWGSCPSPYIDGGAVCTAPT